MDQHLADSPIFLSFGKVSRCRKLMAGVGLPCHVPLPLTSFTPFHSTQDTHRYFRISGRSGAFTLRKLRADSRFLYFTLASYAFFGFDTHISAWIKAKNMFRREWSLRAKQSFRSYSYGQPTTNRLL